MPIEYINQSESMFYTGKKVWTALNLIIVLCLFNKLTRIKKTKKFLKFTLFNVMSIQFT